MKIPLAKPFIPNTVLKEMKSLIKKGFLTEGNYTKKFEKYVKEFLDEKMENKIMERIMNIYMKNKSV